MTLYFKQRIELKFFTNPFLLPAYRATERELKTPSKTFPELMKELEPEHFKKLRSEQAVTFFKLKDFSKQFPPQQQEEFNLLMQNTDKKLSNAPVIVPFSSFEFQYKLQKLYDTVSEHGNRDEIKTMRRLLHYATQLNANTNNRIVSSFLMGFEYKNHLLVD